MKKTRINLTIFVLFAIALWNASGDDCQKLKDPVICGACPHGCVYWVFCGLNANGIQTCDGTSPGETYTDGVLDDPGSKKSAYLWPRFCGSYVTLVSACCGGARSDTFDSTPIIEVLLQDNTYCGGGA